MFVNETVGSYSIINKWIAYWFGNCDMDLTQPLNSPAYPLAKWKEIICSIRDIPSEFYHGKRRHYKVVQVYQNTTLCTLNIYDFSILNKNDVSWSLLIIIMFLLQCSGVCKCNVFSCKYQDWKTYEVHTELETWKQQGIKDKSCIPESSDLCSICE